MTKDASADVEMGQPSPSIRHTTGVRITFKVWVALVGRQVGVQAA
jgi:hypothetical protein